MIIRPDREDPFARQTKDYYEVFLAYFAVETEHRTYQIMRIVSDQTQLLDVSYEFTGKYVGSDIPLFKRK